MGVNETRILEETLKSTSGVDQKVAGLLAPKQVTFTGSLTNAGTATVAALDAVGGTMRRISFTVYYSGAVAGLGITPRVFVTSYGAPVTFVELQMPNLPGNPVIGSQHAFAAARYEIYPVGQYQDLPAGLQMELRVDSNGDDSGVTYEATVTYED